MSSRDALFEPVRQLFDPGFPPGRRRESAMRSIPVAFTDPTV
jgi:hypothetical protein